MNPIWEFSNVTLRLMLLVINANIFPSCEEKNILNIFKLFQLFCHGLYVLFEMSLPSVYMNVIKDVICFRN